MLVHASYGCLKEKGICFELLELILYNIFFVFFPTVNFTVYRRKQKKKINDQNEESKVTYQFDVVKHGHGNA